MEETRDLQSQLAALEADPQLRLPVTEPEIESVLGRIEAQPLDETLFLDLDLRPRRRWRFRFANAWRMVSRDCWWFEPLWVSGYGDRDEWTLEIVVLNFRFSWTRSKSRGADEGCVEGGVL